MSLIKQFMVVCLHACVVFNADAQKKNVETKPYKITGAGKQLNIKSSRSIQHIMLWTTEGHRVVEQKNINNYSFTIEIPVYRKAFYLMIILSNGKIYTEKIGIL